MGMQTYPHSSERERDERAPPEAVNLEEARFESEPSRFPLRFSFVLSLSLSLSVCLSVCLSHPYMLLHLEAEL